MNPTTSFMGYNLSDVFKRGISKRLAYNTTLIEMLWKGARSSLRTCNGKPFIRT